MTSAIGVRRADQVHALLGDQVGVAAWGDAGSVAGTAERTVHGRPCWVAFYGSIYRREGSLSAERVADGSLQILLEAYLRDGIGFLTQLRGEFSLAIWDGSEDRLYLASDRFRIHPLFYYLDADTFVYATRINAISTCALPVHLTINGQAIVDVMSSSVVPTPKTIFSEIKKLPPGHVLAIQSGKVSLSPYWRIDFLNQSHESAERLAEQLRAHVSDAVSVRFESERDPERVGTFLSGGVDSSTVTGVLTRAANRPIHCFSIGFAERQFDEISYARIAAQAFKAKHWEYHVTPRDTYDAIPILLDAFDEPFANASAVPTYFCARLAKEHGVDVLYAGDGGDELFAGNERYAGQRTFEAYQIIPQWMRRHLLEPMVSVVPDRLSAGLLGKAKKYIQRANIPYPDRLFSYGLFKIISMPEVLGDSLKDAVGAAYDPDQTLREHYHQAPARSELDRQLYIDLMWTICDNDLFKVTRMTDAAGVRARFPLLDHRLAEFAARVPADIKMPGRKLRAFFKDAFAELLPIEVRSKTKHGFGLPIPVWLRTDRRLNEMMKDLLLSPRSLQRGYVRKHAMERLIERHRNDETSFFGTILWHLMTIELWHRRYWP